MSILKQNQEKKLRVRFWLSSLIIITLVAFSAYKYGQTNTSKFQSTINKVEETRDSLQEIVDMQNFVLEDLNNLGVILDDIKAIKNKINEHYSSSPIDTVAIEELAKQQTQLEEQLSTKEVAIHDLDNKDSYFTSVKSLYQKMQGFQTAIAIAIPEPTEVDTSFVEERNRLLRTINQLTRDNRRLAKRLRDRPTIKVKDEQVQLLLNSCQSELNKTQTKLSKVSSDAKWLKTIPNLLTRNWVQGENDRELKTQLQSTIERLSSY